MAKVTVIEYGGGRVCFECPNCGSTHCVPTSGEIAWGFNGDVERPSLTPSLRTTWGKVDTKQCHIIVTDGIANVCGDDSFHPGQALALQDLPHPGEKA